MAVQTTFPGVYIDEFAPGAPIQGVGTSTTAFVGLSLLGDLDTPTKLTSWDQFQQIFGREPRPGFFLWYAVRGFFENGGQVCYVVRASNGRYDEWTLPDRTGVPTSLAMRIRAVQPGLSGITVDALAASLLPAGATVFKTGAATVAAVAGREIQLGSAAQAAQFRPGDLVQIAGVAGTPQVVRVSGDRVRLGSDPTPPPAVGAAVRLADVAAGTRTIRIHSLVNPLPADSLVPGTMLTIDASAQPGGATDTQIVESVQTEQLGATVTYRVTFRSPLATGFSLAPGAANVGVASEEFDFTVTRGASVTPYLGLSMDPAHPRYFIRRVNGDPGAIVRVFRIEPPPPVAPPHNLPATGAATNVVVGVDENLATFVSQDFIDALDTLRQVDDVNLVSVPDCMAGIAGVNPVVVQQAVITHCEQLADRFGVLDSLPRAELFRSPTHPSVEEQRSGLDSTRGYAALYYPWLRVRPFGAGDPVLVPPSGHVCGIFARSDNTRGVHKAPANELVNGAMGVERTMSDVDQGQLNLQGINVLRVFSSGGRVVVWGARTTATDRNWQYVNIRRLFLYLEESISEGIRWGVFEPNNLGLWQKLRRSITEFLIRAWRDGALFGAKEEEAFYVRIDEVLNPFSEQALGRLHIEIGVRPSYPAEFIIVRIGIWSGGKDVTES
jgi:phage tail sheath protein FI